MRRPGMVSPAKAARMLGVHINTVYSWCRNSVRGLPSRLKNVERHQVTGYFFIDIEEVNSMRANPDSYLLDEEP